MKNIYFLIIAILISSGNLFAQAPQKFNYQAVARDASGNLIANQSVNFRISILQASASGTAVYVETHAKTTNAFGQATLVIGGGTIVSGNFSIISWGNNSYYLKTEMDATGGSTFALMGTTQLLSVPYALYSNTAGSGGNSYTGGTGINVNGTTINNTSPDQTVVLTGTGATTVTGTYPNFSINSTDNNTTYTAGSGISVAGTVISNTQPNATHTGDATGNSALTVVKLQGRDIATTAPVNGQALKWNSSTLKWEPATDMNTTYTNGNGINITGSTISNTSPDQTVTLNGTGATTVSGTYPNFTINSTDNNTTYTSGTGINISGTTVNNTAPDQTVTITSGTGISASGTYPNLTIVNTSQDQIVNLTGNGATEIIGTYPNFTIKSTDNNNIYNAGTGIEINGTTISNTQPNATHTGDVTGDDTLTVISFRGNPLSTNNPNTGQVLKWNGTEWDPSAIDVLPSGLMGQTLMHDGLNWMATNNLYNDGNNVGIGIFPASDKLEVQNGNILISNNTGVPAMLKLAEPSVDGFNYTAFKAQSQTSDINYTLPSTAGNNGEVLTTNGMGDLSWTNGGGSIPSGTMGQTLWNNGSNWASGNLLYNNDTSIGIGTTMPTAQLHVKGLATGQGNVLFEGELKNPFFGQTPGDVPANGIGTRMIWYPDKAAFRAGYVDGPNWDTDSIGLWSLAMGFDTKASGYSSTAIGEKTTASGSKSTAMGGYTTATGSTSTAMGYSTIASGEGSTAMGWLTRATGEKSTTMGFGTTASGSYSTAMGEFSTASGEKSTAIGDQTTASGISSTSIGTNTKAKSYAETVIGCYNTDYSQSDSTWWNVNDRLFVIGNGTYSNRSNALTMLKNGNTGLGFENPIKKLEVNGEIKGLRLIAYGPGNVNTNTAIGEQALNIINTGNFNTAIGSNSLMVNSIGNNNVAIGTNALYTNSTGNNNIGIGVNATVLYNNSNSIAIGDLSVSYTSNMAVIGNTATSIIGGYVDWSILSDGRFKRNIKQNVPGISFIMKLHPVTYNLDINKLNRAIYHTDTIAFDKESINSKEKEIQSGFIAQDVEKAAQEVGYDFNGVVKPQNENEHYALRYAEFVVPLVKAVQEQQLMIEELKKQNEELLKRLEKLENK
jgi:hypothetical protein